MITVLGIVYLCTYEYSTGSKRDLACSYQGSTARFLADPPDSQG